MKDWGSELWDRVDKVDDRFNDQIAKNDRLIRFLREKAKIDLDYSKNLKRLATKYEKAQIDENFTTGVAFRTRFAQFFSKKKQTHMKVFKIIIK